MDSRCHGGSWLNIASKSGQGRRGAGWSWPTWPWWDYDQRRRELQNPTSPGCFVLFLRPPIYRSPEEVEFFNSHWTWPLLYGSQPVFFPLPYSSRGHTRAVVKCSFEHIKRTLNSSCVYSVLWFVVALKIFNQNGFT